MREVTKTFKLFRYDKLDESAKEAVKQFYLDDLVANSYLWTSLLKSNLENDFPNSNLDVEYSYWKCCQGDGFNIYGKLNMFDIYKKIKEKMYPESKEYFDKKIDLLKSLYVNLKPNKDYTYCTCGSYLIFDVLEDSIPNISKIGGEQEEMAADNFANKANSYIHKYCNEWMDETEIYFTEVEEAELKSWCEDNDFEFYENGDLYQKEEK